MPSATRSHPYDHAAAGWTTRIASLGYPAAYRWLIARACRGGPFARTILDAGCGTGDFAGAYLDHSDGAAAITLVDPSANMLAQARLRFVRHLGPITAICTRTADMPVQHRHDLVLCAHAVEHSDNPVSDLVRLGAAMAPTGRMLLIVSKPHWCNRLIWLRWRHRSYRPAAMRAIIRAADLDCIADYGFPDGPPRRTSHAYIITQP